MKVLRLHTTLLLLLLCGTAGAQTTPKERSFGAGAAFCLPFDAMIGDVPKGINVYYLCNKQQVSLQLDLYRISRGSSLTGFEADYRYYFTKHFFAGTKMIYRQYGWGKQAGSRYNFAFNTGSRYTLERYQSFIHMAGIGYRFKLFGPLWMWAAGGGGYNYYSDELSDAYYPIFADSRKQKEYKLKSVAYLELGMAVQIWNSLKPEIEKKKRMKEEEIPWD